MQHFAQSKEGISLAWPAGSLAYSEVQGFQQMPVLEPVRARKICNGACYLEYAMVGPVRECKLLHGPDNKMPLLVA
mgnify:CR=1 FL=1